MTCDRTVNGLKCIICYLLIPREIMTSDRTVNKLNKCIMALLRDYDQSDQPNLLFSGLVA